jgi:hypothetical protein
MGGVTGGVEWIWLTNDEDEPVLIVIVVHDGRSRWSVNGIGPHWDHKREPLSERSKKGQAEYKQSQPLLIRLETNVHPTRKVYPSASTPAACSPDWVLVIRETGEESRTARFLKQTATNDGSL